MIEDKDSPAKEINFLVITPGTGRSEETGRVATESVLTVQVADLGTYTLMCSPRDQTPLAVGFAFSEGLISCIGDIAACCTCPDDPSVVRIQLTEPHRARSAERTLVVTSSCGICGGKTQIEAFMEHPPQVEESLRVDPEFLESIHGKMWEKQKVHRLTSSTHAAALFNREGDIVSFAEDVGRHNALDKVIGKCLLEKIEMNGLGAAISSRMSFELVTKAARAGLEIIAAVSAPTSLAVEAARKSGVTLFQFRRKGCWSVYSHPERISETS